MYLFLEMLGSIWTHHTFCMYLSLFVVWSIMSGTVHTLRLTPYGCSALSLRQVGHARPTKK